MKRKISSLLTVLAFIFSLQSLAQKQTSYLLARAGIDLGFSKLEYGFVNEYEFAGQTNREVYTNTFKPGNSINGGVGFGMFITENFMVDVTADYALNLSYQSQSVNGYETVQGVWFNRLSTDIAARYLFELSDNVLVGPGVGVNYYIPFKFGYKFNDFNYDVAYQSSFGLNGGADLLFGLDESKKILTQIHYTSARLKVRGDHTENEYTESFDFSTMNLSALSLKIGFIYCFN